MIDPIKTALGATFQAGSAALGSGPQFMKPDDMSAQRQLDSEFDKLVSTDKKSGEFNLFLKDKSDFGFVPKLLSSGAKNAFGLSQKEIETIYKTVDL